MGSGLHNTRVATTTPGGFARVGVADRVSRPTRFDPAGVPLLSVILVGQRSLATQRRGRFAAGSAAHPARMAPDLAAHLIRDYTEPGDLVFDPLAGIGTTLVEAIHLGRDTVGVDLELGWATLAKANIGLARRQTVTRGDRAGRGWIVHGDATQLPRGVPAGLRGRVALVLTSPPYGRTMHGRVEHRDGQLRRFHDRYSHQGSTDQTNLGHRRRPGLAEGIAAVLTGCAPLLKPGGVVAVVARPWRRGRYLHDLPGTVIDAGERAGLTLVDCRRAIHAALRDGRLVPRHTFWQLDGARKTRTKGVPVSLIQHDDIAVFQRLDAGQPR